MPPHTFAVVIGAVHHFYSRAVMTVFVEDGIRGGEAGRA